MMVSRKAGFVGALLLSLVPSGDLKGIICENPKSLESIVSEVPGSDEQSTLEKQNLDRMYKEEERSKDPKFYYNKLKSILGKKYAELEKDPKKRIFWNRYWENSTRNVLKQACTIYTAPNYFFNNLSENKKKDYREFKKKFKNKEIRKEGHYDYFCWINEKDMTESDFLIIWNLNYSIKSVIPKELNKINNSLD